ncbi:hypothetical protein NIA71_04155 [Ihubacter massiliensis]|uniref:Uncharacterized protein n=1 Tax=Hominibacterium faecale TaxID=2839743 RepID=A0A9J6QPY3_9FIRM|nr:MULTISPECIES: hypothetical protein [Eubacteriales Family XIII. Incertae Sedis]MCO7121142.1 hypothetical protein [Ihubacter massiliensis]MCU7378058.1 hypothetical protein [Hominibacterium faecale]
MIFITFKDVKRDTWEETYDQISSILRQEFERHSELLESEHCNIYKKAYFKTVVEEKADDTDMMMSLQRLSQMLDEHYGILLASFIRRFETTLLPYTVFCWLPDI